MLWEPSPVVGSRLAKQVSQMTRQIRKGSGNGSRGFWTVCIHLYPHGHPCSVTLGSYVASSCLSFLVCDKEIIMPITSHTQGSQISS